MAEDKQKRLVRYLEDAYAAEQGSLKALESLQAEATNAELKNAVVMHIEQTQRQADRIEQRLQALGEDKSTSKSIIDQIAAIGSHFANIGHDHEDKQTQDTIKAIGLEAFEVGTYTSLHTYAEGIGDQETADLAKSILAEEKQAEMKLLELLPSIAAESLQKVGAAA